MRATEALLTESPEETVQVEQLRETAESLAERHADLKPRAVTSSSSSQRAG